MNVYVLLCNVIQLAYLIVYRYTHLYTKGFKLGSATYNPFICVKITQISTIYYFYCACVCVVNDPVRVHKTRAFEIFRLCELYSCTSRVGFKEPLHNTVVLTTIMYCRYMCILLNWCATPLQSYPMYRLLPMTLDFPIIPPIYLQRYSILC